MAEKPCTALIKFQHPWAVDDPVLDYIIYRHDIEIYRQMQQWETEEKDSELLKGEVS